MTHKHKPSPKRAIAEQALRTAGLMTRQQIAEAAGSAPECAHVWLQHWQARREVVPGGFEHGVKTRGRPSRILWKWVGAR